MIRTVKMTEEEFEHFKHVEGLEKSYKSTLAQMTIQQKQARELAESVVRMFEEIENLKTIGSSASRVLELAQDVLA